MAQAPVIVSYQQAREDLDNTFVAACTVRADQRSQWLILPGDDKTTIEVKSAFLIECLKAWAVNPLLFIQQNAWAPDPLEKFAQIPEGMTPKGMIPLLPFMKQKEFVKMWWEALNDRRRCDIFGEKSRQQAFTTLACWLCLHAWLFKKSCYGMLTTFDEDKIDKGGKGQRESDSLFGRLRLFLDAFMWQFGPCVGPGFASLLKFNQDKAPVGRPKVAIKKKWDDNLTGLDESDDITKKLTRPRWVVGSAKTGWRELFPGAEGNYIVGEMPSDAAGRSLSLTYAIFDELAHYRKEIKRQATPDDDVYSASASNIRVRVGWGTPPKGGGSDTLLYRAMHVDPPSSIVKKVRMHWTENPAFMIGAWWVCRECGHANPAPAHPAPQWPNEVKKCDGCRQDIVVRARGINAPSGGDYSSVLYEDECAALRSKAGIAAELEIDWGGALTGVVFSNFDLVSQVVPRAHTRKWITIHSIDPGYNVKNPAAWSCWRYSPADDLIRLVGYHQAAEWEFWQWVPFLKCWSPDALARMPMKHRSLGEDGPKRWSEYEYSDSARWMMKRMSMLASREEGFTRAHYRGDNYGKNRNLGMESAYEALERIYGIQVENEYVPDNEALIQDLRDNWVPRMEIDPEIVEHRPSAPHGTYPTFCEALMQARWIETTGQREEKREIANDPPHILHYIDTAKYAVMEIDEIRAAQATQDGWEMGTAGDEPFYYGADRSLV